jgi:hypothetical protein
MKPPGVKCECGQADNQLIGSQVVINSSPPSTVSQQSHNQTGAHVYVTADCYSRRTTSHFNHNFQLLKLSYP